MSKVIEEAADSATGPTKNVKVSKEIHLELLRLRGDLGGIPMGKLTEELLRWAISERRRKLREEKKAGPGKTR